jgi:hypothetical protein
MKFRIFPSSAVFYTSLLLIFFFCESFAQTSFTVSGTIKDAESGESLIGATIMVRELKGTGAASNAYGYYSLTIPGGTYTLVTRYVGYRTRTDTISLFKNLSLNIQVVPEMIKEGEVVISGERSNTNVVSTEMSVNKLEVQNIKYIPVLLGEKDVLKTIQLLPGVKAASEGNSGFTVRGGGIDQNLILLDEAPVYNPSHVMGYLSVFNSDAIKDVKMITGGIPAEYGGRLSSVLDIRTNDGNAKYVEGTGGIGLLSSRLTVEGPIVRDQGSFIVSGRRTYADLFLKLSSDTTLKNVSLYFYDFNAKANFMLGEFDRVYISGYLGSDNFNYPNMFGFRWGNTTGTARWNHIFGEQLFSNISLIYTDYQYSNTRGVGTSQYEITSGIRDLNAKLDLEYFPNSQSTWKFGIQSIYHTFTPGTVTSGSTSASSRTIEQKYALENAGYAAHEYEILPILKINYGLRMSTFSLLGPGTFYTYTNDGEIKDSTISTTHAFMKTYFSLEPRIALTYLLDETSSLKASYMRMVQYLHLLSSSTSTNPSDLWIPSSTNVQPQYADQITVGYFQNFDDNAYESSLEVYYKGMQNLIDYRNGADLQLNPLVESQLLFGKGWSYGAEILLKKKIGVINGWIGYTLSRTEMQSDQINNGVKYPAQQDRTHDLSIVIIYNYSTGWNFSATWVYHTGNAVTFPSGNYIIEGRLVPFYTDRNSYRMPAYHRLDLSATWTLGDHSNLNFSVYNAYNRMNPFTIFFRQMPSDRTQTEAVQMTLFPIIPSVTYNFTF